MSISSDHCASGNLTYDLSSISGRVAIVTGSSSGNGRAIALALASEGAYLVCSDLSPELRAGGYEKSQVPTHELIVQQKGKAIFQKADASSVDDVKGLVGLAVQTYGRLDIMVNNAGIFMGLANIMDEPVENYDKTMAVNARGVYLGMKYAITQMMKQDPLPSGERGWIVNIASIGGQVGLALERAVVNLTRQVAVDFAKHKIHVNAVCPGFLATAMVRPFLEQADTNKLLHDQSPWPHLGTPEDVAKAVLVLASDAASWMTGGMMQVDGGFVAR
ncbi:uncharacterized protein Z518_07490 [Rhinocladiella mackenziei CBS 650.93]|uniref:Uncharacterized protein n=1 Tax=Rhinocladiella mackenziei CBS 650.93 TaxID=1442369 RepID=A0A0D2FP87_9EURO|nr:uncharacterized protein Z518_07490 [Rhinocladiella mackenziei CBS 650.93]KIX03937.1 hypothetical protein Z518_07490 [Rhinocladiella mackenziei CBS 650.93]